MQEFQKDINNYDEVMEDIQNQISSLTNRLAIIKMKEQFISNEMKNLEDAILMMKSDAKKVEKAAMLKTYNSIIESYQLFHESYIKYSSIIQSYVKLKGDIVEKKINSTIKIKDHIAEMNSKSNEYYTNMNNITDELQEQIKKQLEQEGF